MRKISINDLPPELVIKVFRFLNVVNLKQATLVCKLWNNLIETACRWSLKLDNVHKLRVQNNGQKMNFILTTNRKFGAIEILEGSLIEKEQIYKIFQRHGFNVVKLILYDCRIGNQTALAELLNLTPNLKHAFFQWTRFYGDVPMDQVLPDLKKLKKLVMWDTDLRVIGCFRKSKLTTMAITEYQRSDHYGLLVDFLLRQEMLTSLTLYAGDFLLKSILAEMGKLSVPIPFRLTKLNISYSEGDASSSGHLLKFVKSQAESLTKMEMDFDIPSSLLEYVFAMPKLNTLTVPVGKIPRNNNCYKRLKKNCCVRTLKLNDFSLDASGDTQYFVNFLKKLPNIRSLILPYGFCPKETASVIGQNLSKLESLSIGSFDQVHSIDFVKFSNLKALHIERLWVKINWNEFTKFHSRLTELTIVNVLKICLTSDDIDQITTNVDLQLIRLGVGFVADEQFFEIIRTKCRNLQMLNLHRSCVSHGLSHDAAINVLRLCDDFKFLSVFHGEFQGLSLLSNV